MVDVWTVSGKCYLAGSTNPVAGVIVSCGAVDVSSASDGSYSIRGVAAGDHLLTAHKSGLLDYSEKIHVDADVPMNVFLDFKRMNISGYVVNSVDGPISGARVKLATYVDVTDISGRFQFFNVPQVSDSLVVTHPDYNPSIAPVVVGDSTQRFDVTLTKDTVLTGNALTTQYVDQVFPNSYFPVWPNNDRVYLRANGVDSLGMYVGGVQRNIFLTFQFPPLLNQPSVTLVEGALELCTDKEYAPFDVQTYVIELSPSLLLTYANQPGVGALLFSGTVVNTAPGKYSAVLVTDGLKVLLARQQVQGVSPVVEIRGGFVYPVGFYSVQATANKPRLRYTIHY
ncbi:MAG: carboxypeptidase-like regulatory domain-containing protein [Ignavibacteriales bacterium]|nr:carboxypeptidase-like regulatory domain-containing protein [Ignavibacteriales bacterium]